MIGTSLSGVGGVAGGGSGGTAAGMGGGGTGGCSGWQAASSRMPAAITVRPAKPRWVRMAPLSRAAPPPSSFPAGRWRLFGGGRGPCGARVMRLLDEEEGEEAAEGEEAEAEDVHAVVHGARGEEEADDGAQSGEGADDPVNHVDHSCEGKGKGVHRRDRRRGCGRRRRRDPRTGPSAAPRER